MSARWIVPFAVIAAAACSAGSAASPAAATYAVETGVKGVADLYDLSSVARTPDGFSIVDVATSRSFPRIFGPVAYRVSRETYHCGRATYEISAVQEFRRDGGRLDSLAGQRRDAMRLVAATASSEMYNRFCPPGAAGKLAGLAPVRTVKADSRFAAYRIGRDVLAKAAS